MSEERVIVVYGPDKPALQWALLYPEKGQSVTFKIPDDVVEAQIAEMTETGNGFDFGLRGMFCTGRLSNRNFRGTYSVESRTGLLTLVN